MLVATATSVPHALAIADACVEAAPALGLQTLAQEGRETARWVLVDLGHIVVHVFQEQDRGYYDLDGLWLDAPRVEVPGADQTVALYPAASAMR